MDLTIAIKRSSYIPHSIYLRGTIGMGALGGSMFFFVVVNF